MAEAIAIHCASRIVFSSAGLEPTAIDAKTLSFLREKGLDASRQTSKALDQVPNIDHYQIIVALANEAKKVFPGPPTKTVCLDWTVADPSIVQGSPAEIQAAYEETYRFLHDHITGLVEAVLGNNMDSRRSNAL
jgi:protein-tyrosine-phosphatase